MNPIFKSLGHTLDPDGLYKYTLLDPESHLKQNAPDWLSLPGKCRQMGDLFKSVFVADEILTNDGM